MVQHAGSRARSVSRARVRNLASAALVTALMAASGWISIPLGSVPVTLQVFAVVLAALLLPSAWAAASLGVYLVLGTIGVPVFASGTAGLGVVLGPTGGYVLGFVLAAPFAAFVRESLERTGATQLVADAAAGVVAIAVIYALGGAQLAVVAHLSALQALLAGVAPFVVPDAIKAAAAITVATAVRRATSGR